MTDYNDLPLDRDSHDLPMSLLSDGVSGGDPEDHGTRCIWCDRRWLGCGPCPVCVQQEYDDARKGE